MKISLVQSAQSRIFLATLLLLLVPAQSVQWYAYGRAAEIIRADRVATVVRVADTRRDQLAMVLRRAHLRAKSALASLQSRCGANSVREACARAELRVFLDDEQALGVVLHESDGRRLSLGDPSLPADEIPKLGAGQLASFTGAAPDLSRRYFVVVDDPDTGAAISVTYSVRALQGIFVPHPDLGMSGESFLTDAEGFFISKSRYASVQGHSHPISAAPLLRCLHSEDGAALDIDYRNVAVIHGFRFVPEIGGGCLMAHIDQTEAFASIADLRQQFLAAAVSYGVLAALAAWIFAPWVLREAQREQN